MPCPDSTPNIQPDASTKTIWHRISGTLIIGGLPGFIWGWFHVPDEAGTASWVSFLQVYKLPLLGLVLTLTLYIIISQLLQSKNNRILISIFAAASVSCYYWYRIPSLFGFGNFATDGLLINLHEQVSSWIITVITSFTTIFFFYWLVIRKQNKKSWVIRPRYASKLDLPEYAHSA